jgi:GntR family transcriptional regulator, transcriptional repressor for pyruvate dehydrogenase complex
MIRRHDALAERVAASVLDAIAGGDFPPGSQLPPEPELVKLTGVSRLTVREAVKSLESKGVLRVEHGRGTFVNPPSTWSPFDPAVLEARLASTVERAGLAAKLLEARRLVEVGVAELAAERRTADDLERLESALERMRRAQASADVDEFVDADVAFHDAVLDAADNELIVALFAPIKQLIYAGRRATSRWPDAREHAIVAHAGVLEAVRGHRPDQAQQAMRGHLLQTADDLRRYGDGEQQAGAARAGEAGA